MSKKKLYGSLFLNSFTLVSVIVCMIILIKRNPNTFRMFTTESNLISGIVSLIIVIFEILILIKKRKNLPNWLNKLKMITTTGVSLTLVVVVFYLGFVAISQGYNYFIVFRGTNICFHFLTPVSAILSFILFEGSNINFKFTFLNLIHMVSYTIFYVINVFTHLNNGKADKKYDWYYFVVGENYTIIFMVVIILIVTYFIGFSLWILNKKIYMKSILKEE